MILFTDEQFVKPQNAEESLNTNNSFDPFSISSSSSSSSSLAHQHTESCSLVNRHRSAASKHIVRIKIDHSLRDFRSTHFL